MNMFKKAGGFTLVELIVVIAILAILAGVAVPVYSGYIANANKAADEQKIEAVNTAIAAALAMEGKNAKDHAAQYFKIDTDGLTIASAEQTPGKVWTNFVQFYAQTSYKLDLDYFATVTLTNGEVVGVPAA